MKTIWGRISITGLAVIIAVWLLSPIAGLFSQATLNSFSEVYSDENFYKSLWVTLLSGAAGAIASIVGALFFSRFFALYTWKGKRIQRLALLIPYLIPNFILAMSFVMAWNPTTGILNSWLKFPLGLYGLFGMTTLFAVSHLPVAFLLLEEKVRRIDPCYREVARLSGASTFRLFLKIELPLLKPAILSALSLCFALNISAFAIPAWIAAPERVYPLTYRIYQSIQLGGLDSLNEAAPVAFVLFILATLPIFLERRIRGDEKKYAVLSGKGARLIEDRPRLKSYLAFQTLFLSTQLVFWLLPLATLFISTLVKPGCLQSSGLSCLSDWSFSKYYYVLVDLTETRTALKGSLLYGGIAALIVVLISILTLILSSKSRRLQSVFTSLYTLPVATPGAIIALGVIVIYSGRFGLNIYNTPWIAVVAYIIKHLSLAHQPLQTGFYNISSSLLEAAQLCGATPRSLWTQIVLPILRPEVFGAFFLVFIPIMGELTMSVFLTSPEFKTIGTVLFDLQDYADHAAAAALAIVLVLLILISNEMARLLSRGRLGY